MKQSVIFGAGIDEEEFTFCLSIARGEAEGTEETKRRWVSYRRDIKEKRNRTFANELADLNMYYASCMLHRHVFILQGVNYDEFVELPLMPSGAELSEANKHKSNSREQLIKRLR